MTFHQFLLALKARRKLFGFIVLVTVLLAAVVSLLLPRTYVARASVLVDKTGELLGFNDFKEVNRVLDALVARPAVIKGLNIPARD